MSADGRLVATTSEDGTTILWSLPGWHRLGAPLRFAAAAAPATGSSARTAAGSPSQTLNRGVVQDREEIWMSARAAASASCARPAASRTARFSPTAGCSPSPTSSAACTLLHGDVEAGDRFVVDGGAAWVAFTPDSATLRRAQTTARCGSSTSPTGRRSARSRARAARTAVPMFMPGGTGLVAGQQDGSATLWDLRPASLARRACEIAGRRLTHAEWDAALPGRDYAPAC